MSLVASCTQNDDTVTHATKQKKTTFSSIMLKRIASSTKGAAKKVVDTTTSAAAKSVQLVQSSVTRVSNVVIQRPVASGIVVACVAAAVAFAIVLLRKVRSKGSIHEVGSADDARAELAGGAGVLVYAPWCPHCKAAMPRVAEAAKRAKCRVVKYNGDTGGIEVEGYPTLLCGDSQLVGLRSVDEYMKQLSQS